MRLIDGIVFKSDVEDTMPLVYRVTAPDLLILPFCELIGLETQRCPDPWEGCDIRGCTVPPPARFDGDEKVKDTAETPEIPEMIR